MDYHAELGSLVIVGSVSGTSIGTLTLREGRWVAMSTPPEPGPRCLPGVAFDAERGVLVMFGGCDAAASAIFDDTWEYDGAAWRAIP